MWVRGLLPTIMPKPLMQGISSLLKSGGYILSVISWRIVSFLDLALEPLISFLLFLLDVTGLGRLSYHLVKSHETLEFHPNHGKFTKLEKRNTVAQRNEAEYENGIVFSHRPVQINEAICVRILRRTSRWKGTLFFGFTNRDPALFSTQRLSSALALRQPLRDGFSFISPGTFYDNIYSKLVFSIDSEGTCCYQIDREEPQLFKTEFINPMRALWAIFDLYGAVTAIQLVHSETRFIRTLDSSVPRSLFSRRTCGRLSEPTFRKSTKYIHRDDCRSSFFNVLSPAKYIVSELFGRNQAQNAVCNNKILALEDEAAVRDRENRISRDAQDPDLCVICEERVRSKAFAECGSFYCCYHCFRRHFLSQISLSGLCRCPICEDVITKSRNPSRRKSKSPSEVNVKMKEEGDEGDICFICLEKVEKVGGEGDELSFYCHQCFQRAYVSRIARSGICGCDGCRRVLREAVRIFE